LIAREHGGPGTVTEVRPPVDVVVPFAGSYMALTGLLDRLGELRLGPQDSLTVVDNRPATATRTVQNDTRVIRAPGRQSPAFARNAGARRGSAEWIIFIDSDTEAAPDLADQYFAAGLPGDDVAVLAGAIRDQEPGPGRGNAAARYAFLRKSMDQQTTKARLGPFAKTANAAVRRQPFEDLGGFRDNVMSGEDVDLCYRLQHAGWRLEFRDEPVVEHRGRSSVLQLLRQQVGHGAGTQWLDQVYPGFSPPFRWSSLVVSLVRGFVKAGIALARGDRDRALIEALDPATALAFHLGRLTTNRVNGP
jgi:GT2 family glycosyltransferase